jgi:hypothetical protein
MDNLATFPEPAMKGSLPVASFSSDPADGSVRDLVVAVSGTVWRTTHVLWGSGMTIDF